MIAEDAGSWCCRRNGGEAAKREQLRLVSLEKVLNFIARQISLSLSLSLSAWEIAE